MLFHSFDFALFLVITLLAFYLFPSRARIYLLLLADILFYAVTGIEYLALFILISVIVYFCALKVGSRYGRAYLWLGILIAACNLVFFKYTDFILENVGRESTLTVHLILPLGISFYTFRLIAYLVDVARKEIEPCRSILVFWVFVSFFGCLIAGPIMRGKSFLPQIEKIRQNSFQMENIKHGSYYIVLGLIKKIVFADSLTPKVDFYFSQIANLNSLDGWFAAYLFAFQIYFDFSAYSDMAVGISRLFGLKLDINFKTPYISANAAEFWKRWHITLSSWIRDYIYIPLGGSRKGIFLQYLFIIAAMAVSGLWHGAAWTFVLWGVYHGLLSVGHKIFTVLTKKARSSFAGSFTCRIVSVFLFFQFTVVGWVFFRAGNINEAFSLIYSMVSFSRLDYDPVYLFYFLFIAFLYLLHWAEYYLTARKDTLLSFWEENVPDYLRAAVCTIVLLGLILFIRTEQNTFIYFQF